MKGIIIAAGVGDRLLYLTKNMPKCLLRVRGKPILEHQLEVLRDVGIKDISVIKGFMQEQINYPGIKYYINDDYQNNNILESLFYAEKELNDDIIVAYSDIIFEKKIVESLIKSSWDISLAVEKEWKAGYVARIDSPIQEAEKVILDRHNLVKNIGKRINEGVADGEFIGIARFTKKGTDILKSTYRRLLLDFKDLPLHESACLKNAYLTDIIQELINSGQEVCAVPVYGGWTEIDTIGDLKLAGGEISLPKIAPEYRRKMLREMIERGELVRAIESHNGLSAIVASSTVIGPRKKSFKAIWISSLTDSAARGQPDIELMGLEQRIGTVNQVLESTNLPLIVDADTGGDPNSFDYFIRKLENLGVSAVIVEDKKYPKRNSLDPDSKHVLEDPDIFAKKIKRAKKALLTSQFMVIARIESFIAGYGLDEAIKRAKIYLESGADAIMIHSNSNSPDEVFSFSKEYGKLCDLYNRKPLVCAPTTYNSARESELQEHGFNIVIYANHLLRASLKAMQLVSRLILENDRSLETDYYCSSVGEIMDMVGYSDVKNKEKEF